MIIRSLELRNIRSYEDARLEFSPGRTLFEGDIGSGKSSLLMAIEFAFFGLGSEQGGAMLRVGEKEGRVEMTFEVEGVEYTVVRTLERKGDRVQQGPGSLEEKGRSMTYSPSELKEKILEILGFNEAPDPKAQSWIYRYAVYTPQEEMKSVLGLSPELRLQILRRAFRVEDYKIAAENAEDVAREVKSEARVRDAEATGVEGLREQLGDLGRDQARLLDSVSSLTEREQKTDADLRRQRDQVRSLLEEKAKLAGLKAERSHEERVAADAGRRLQGLQRDLEASGKRASQIEAEISQLATRGEGPERPMDEIDLSISDSEAKARELNELKGRVGGKLSEYESILRDGMCPVCDREVVANDFGPRKDRKAEELHHIVAEIASLEGLIGSLKRERAESERRTKDVERASALREDLARRREEERLKAEEVADLRKAKVEAEERAAALAREIDGSRAMEERLAEFEASAEATERSLRKVREELAADKRDLELSVRRQKELSAEVATKEKAARMRDAARERSLWLTDYFVPTVRLVERSVLGAINREFDELFRKWFAMLVGDSDKEAWVDGDFTPIVSQEGYEQDVWYLSGGERTSVALAYRLALNTLTQKVAASMRSNLLILDEPTDGFSKEQLSNVRDVLDDLASPQVIMVSHDRELESFADQIVRVSKSGGHSTLQVPHD